MSLERLSHRASSNSIPDLQYLKSVSRVFEIEISVVDFLTISIEEKSHAGASSVCLETYSFSAGLTDIQANVDKK